MNERRLGWLIAFGSIIVGAASIGGGCGSDDSTAITGDPDAAADGASGSSSGTTSGSSSGSTTSSSSSGSSSGGTDGGTDAAPNPNKVSCGSAECDVTSQVCCVSATPNDAGTTSTCQAADAGCTGASVACDEKADCTGQDMCCTNVGGGALSSECKGSCGGAQDVQLCKIAAECGDGGACSEYTCPLGRKVRACTKPFGCN